MVAPVDVGTVEDSFVRIAPNNSSQIIRADITQSLVENENGHSPVSRQIGELIANQIRQTEANPSLLSETNALNQSLQAEMSKQNDSSAVESDKSVVGSPNSVVTDTQQSLSNRTSPATGGCNAVQESRSLFQSLPISQQRSIAIRMRSKISVSRRTHRQPVTEAQKVVLIEMLQKDVKDLQKDNMDLRRKVTLFQQLFRDREKLDKVLKKLEENGQC